MKKLLLPVMMLSLLFVACDSDDDKEYTEVEKIAKDVNGEYLFTKASIGDLPVVELTYNNNNLLTTISAYDSDEYKQELKSRVEKEYKDGKVSKITTRSVDNNDDGEKSENVGGVLLEYDSKGNLVKINEWEDKETDVFEYIQNTYNSKNLLSESKLFYFESDEKYDESTGKWVETEGEWIQDKGFLKYEYNSDELLTKTIFVNKDGSETVVSELKYDDKQNPIEIYKYNSPEYDWTYNSATGEYQKVLLEEGKLESIVKIEYDYDMKNFLKHSIGLIFPELISFNLNNAPKRITQTGTIVAGSITYENFNEGGYPQVLKFLGNAEDAITYQGEVNLEFQKKK